jgi:ParB family transcriptional regulator, chromosome partitioning protein
MSAENQPRVSEIYDIPLEQINIGDHNVRLTNPEKDLDQLAASIKRQGLLQPIVLEGEYGSPPYQLVSGQRRFLAHERFLHAKAIQAVFVGKISRTEAIIRSLVENLQRADLEFRDTANAVTELYKELGSDEAVRDATGLSLRRIRSHLLIEARASEKMKTYLHAGRVSVADVKRSLQAAQDDIAKAERLLDLIVEYNPTSHEKRRLVSYGMKSPGATADDIFADARKPHVEQKLVVALSEDVRAALAEATKSLEMDNAAELVERIIAEWLEQEGFRGEAATKS